MNRYGRWSNLPSMYWALMCPCAAAYSYDDGDDEYDEDSDDEAVDDNKSTTHYSCNRR